MATKDYFFRFRHDDWMLGTIEMTLEQKGFYIDFLALMYSRQNWVEDNRFTAQRMGLRWPRYKRLRDELVAMGKLYHPTAKHLSNRVAEKEIEYLLKKRGK